MSELGQRPDTYVAEVEIGDIDGDGREEFFAALDHRDPAAASQRGEVVMYRWDGSEYVPSVVESFTKRHAKEILAADMDGDGASELLGAVGAEIENNVVVKPSEIRQYTLNENGVFTSKLLVTLDDRGIDSLVPGDFDADGDTDLVAAATATGLWLLRNDGEGIWKKVQIDEDAGDFVHPCATADLDGDGRPAVVAVAGDRELRSYAWDPEIDGFRPEILGTLPEHTITWDVVVGEL